MRAKSMHSAWHANPAECFAPRNRVGLSARLHGQSIWWRATATNDLVDLFLNVDERLLHSAPTLSEPAWPGKLSPLTCGVAFKISLFGAIKISHGRLGGGLAQTSA